MGYKEKLEDDGDELWEGEAFMETLWSLSLCKRRRKHFIKNIMKIWAIAAGNAIKKSQPTTKIGMIICMMTALTTSISRAIEGLKNTPIPLV